MDKNWCRTSLASRVAHSDSANVLVSLFLATLSVAIGGAVSLLALYAFVKAVQ